MTAEKDLITIAPPRGWLNPARELWRHRDLVAFFVWRDLKVRYRQTLVGTAWAILQPLALMVAFTIFLGGIVEVPGEHIGYALFVFTGLVPWTLFAQSVVQASNSIVNHQHLVTKASFPRLVLPVASVGGYVLDFVIASIVAVVAVAVTMGRVPVTVLALPIVGLLAVSVALAIGIGLAALNVRYRDVRYATPFLMQVWLFATPVLYPLEFAPDNLHTLLHLNPVTGIIATYRWLLLGTPPPSAAAIAASAGVALILLAVSITYFSRSEPTFADAV